MLSRALKYADGRFKLADATDRVADAREYPRIPIGVFVRESLMMVLARLGSLNALEQLSPKGFAKAWINGHHPSADRLGDVAELIDANDLRKIICDIYTVLRRGNNLPPMFDGNKVLVLDGHEMSASYLRHCPGCLQRKVNTSSGERVQYYHRYVLAMLIHGKGVLLLDIEPQQPGEDERSASLRLLERVLQNYPRAFEIAAGDALYMDPKLWQLAERYHTYFLAVLKNERTDLLRDARSLFGHQHPVDFSEGKTKRTCWDIEGFTTWPQLGGPVRIVRSVEERTVRRQKTRQDETIESEWIWATNMPGTELSTRQAVRIGHRRWDIENYGFNEFSREWKADHLYRHHPQAILNFLLLALIACIIFRTMVTNNIKPCLRERHSQLHWAEQVKAALYVACGFG